MASPRSYFMGRSPRPDTTPHNQFRTMQQQHHQQQFQQFQQQQQQQMNNQYNPAMMGAGNHYPVQSNAMPGYNNGAPTQMVSAGISPTPSVRNQLGMQASPALAATAPQHFGPSVCHLPQAQAGQPQGQQQPTPMYNNVVANGAVAQQGQQPNMVGCNMQQQQNYSPASYGPQTAPVNAMNNAMGYNNFNNASNMPCNNQPAMAMNNGNGYVMNQQCNHMQQGNPAQGFNNPCSPCNGHHHHQPQPVCNNSPANNNWQCGYPGANTMPQQQQMPFQQQQNNGHWNNAMQSAGTGPAGPMNGQPMMYNMAMQTMQANGIMANYNGYTPRPPPYNQVASAIQCQDVSQSQDFINRVRVQEAGQAGQVPSTPIQQVNNVPVVPSASGTTTPSNMRPETYQRTLEYVQQCQTWATGDNNNGRVAKENKPPQQGASCETMTKTTETAAIGRALLSPGQDAVSSSTDRQEAAAAAAAALLPSAGSANQSNMVVHDMNTSLNSLMQENRYLQMIQ